MVKKTFLLLWLLSSLLLADQAKPDFDSEVPFSVNGISVGMSEANARKIAGEPVKVLNEEMCLYDGNLLLLTRGQKVVNVSVSDASGRWVLKQGNTELTRTGVTAADFEKRFGGPAEIYIHQQKPGVLIAFYPGAFFDMGAIMANNKVMGFMLTEPGVMEAYLGKAGYTAQD